MAESGRIFRLTDDLVHERLDNLLHFLLVLLPDDIQVKVAIAHVAKSGMVSIVEEEREGLGAHGDKEGVRKFGSPMGRAAEPVTSWGPLHSTRRCPNDSSAQKCIG